MRSRCPFLPARLRSSDACSPARRRAPARAGGRLGLIPPRTMHSAEDASVLLEAARGARRVVEIGVYEGSSAVALCGALRSDAELHLVDPFGRHPDALPSGWGATEWATRRAVARALRRRGAEAPAVHWHACLSAELASRWQGEDGPRVHRRRSLRVRMRAGLVGVASFVAARRPRRLPRRSRRPARWARAAGPDRGRHTPFPLRCGTPGWEIAAEADRTVAVRRAVSGWPDSLHDERGLHAFRLVFGQRAEQRVAAGTQVERQVRVGARRGVRQRARF